MKKLMIVLILQASMSVLALQAVQTFGGKLVNTKAITSDVAFEDCSEGETVPDTSIEFWKARQGDVEITRA